MKVNPRIKYFRSLPVGALFHFSAYRSSTLRKTGQTTAVSLTTRGRYNSFTGAERITPARA